MSNSVDINAIKDAVYDWVNSLNLVSPNNIVYEQLNADRPTTPYVSFKIISGPAKIGGRDNVAHITDTSFNIHGPRRATISIKTYGSESLQIATNINDSTELDSVRSILFGYNIAIWGTGGVSDISALLETGFEERAQMDMIFGLTSEQSDDKGAIETTVYSGTIKKEDGSTAATPGDTVP